MLRCCILSKSNHKYDKDIPVAEYQRPVCPYTSIIEYNSMPY